MAAGPDRAGPTPAAVPPRPVTLDHRGATLRGWQWNDPRADDTRVLLVHGFGSDATGSQQLFVQTARALAARGATVRSYSRLGHGFSDGDFADTTIGDEVDQVVAMVRALATAAPVDPAPAAPTRPVHLVAHSLGAVESVLAAARVPELVATLTLWSPAGVVVDDIVGKDEIQGQPLAPVRERGWFDFGGMALGRGFVDEVRAGLDVWGPAATYPGPAEVVHGTADTIVPVAYGRRYADLLPGGTFTAVEGADHGWSSVPWRTQLVDRLLRTVGLG
ncbi:alpha/beta fold hydrolase [Curtobacterium aetherium]|uniref:alpha/beta hydrolase n=1 Tax=Curtobacterium aetherium TaxID=2841594 RepID=UPI003B521F39